MDIKLIGLWFTHTERWAQPRAGCVPCDAVSFFGGSGKQLPEAHDPLI